MDRREPNRLRIFSRRAAVLGGAKLALGAAILGRLYYLQVLQSDQYRVLADENRINLRLLAPPRGRVVDRFGVELARNRRNFRALLVAEQTVDVADTLNRLSQMMPIDDGQKARVLREVQRKRKFVPVMIAENLSWDEFARLNIYSPDLPGILLDVGETRDYPWGQYFAHAVGYVAAVSPQDLGEDPLLELPGFRIGKNGAERVYDLNLRGKAGDSRVEVNAYGRVIRELARVDGQPGAELNLTLDAELQRFAVDRLAGESGAAVVVDVETGDVLVLASTPSFDPNWFNEGIRPEQWQQLGADKMKPLTNKATQGQYPPGSTFKPITLLAALEAGVIGPDHQEVCLGQIQLGNYMYHCWKKGGHGLLDMVSAMEQSCDVYFYDVARRIGPDRIAEMAQRFGMGKPTGIDLPGERVGLVPTREWKQATLGEPWAAGETLVVGIGQGYVLATPLQLAILTARLANGRFAVQPRLTRRGGPAAAGDRDAAAPQFAKLGVRQASLDIVREGMKAVVNRQRGTAYGARINIAGQAMAGKTGTSQVRRISMRERHTRVIKNEDKPWEERDHALFVGYAPVDKPRFAVCVIVEHGGNGSKAAAPVARDILIEAQRLDAVRQIVRRRDDTPDGSGTG
jgi:penicillin-binding protein 2